MKRKMVTAAVVAFCTAAIAVPTMGTTSFGTEATPEPAITEMFRSAELWRTDATDVPTVQDTSVIDLHAEGGGGYGGFVDDGLLLEPSPGKRLAVHETSLGTLCVQANDGMQPKSAWCGTTFESNGLAYAYRSGNVPGLKSMLFGLALPDVTGIELVTTTGSTKVEIVDGAFWWTGSPDELVESMKVIRSGEAVEERARFAPVEKDDTDYPIASDK